MGYVPLVHVFVLDNLCEYRSHTYTAKESGVFGLHYDANKVTERGRTTQTNGHYAVRGHSSSPILVPIESLYYAISC